MKESELDAVSRNLTGGDADSPNGRNLVGAINNLLNVLQTVEDYPTVSSVSDLPDDLQTDLQEAQEDFQFHLQKLSNDLPALVGKDGAFEDEDGNQILDLPNAATEATQTVDAPTAPDTGGS